MITSTASAYFPANTDAGLHIGDNVQERAAYGQGPAYTIGSVIDVIDARTVVIEHCFDGKVTYAADDLLPTDPERVAAQTAAWKAYRDRLNKAC